MAKKTSIDLAIAQEVDKRIAHLQERGEIPSSEDIIDLKDGEEGSQRPTKNSAIQGVFSSFPGSEGWYGKIYKRLTDGGEQCMDYVVESPENLPGDPEIEVQRIIKDKDWGEGTYFFRIFNHDKKIKGFRSNMKIIVGEPTLVERIDKAKKKAEHAASVGASIAGFPGATFIDPAESAIKMTRTMVETAKAMNNPQGQNDVASIMRSAAEIQKNTMEMVRSITPPPAEKNDNSMMLSVMQSMMTAFTESMKAIVMPLTQALQQPKTNEMELITTVMKMVKDLLPSQIQPQKEDFFEAITKAKAAGFLPELRNNGPLSSTKEIVELVSILRPLIGGGDGDTSPLSEAIRVIGPHVPEMVQNVTGAVKDVADVSRMNLEARMGGSVNTRPLFPPRTLTQDGQMNPVIKELVAAVNSQNIDYFPKLREIIVAMGFGHMIDAVVTNQVSPDTFMELIGSIQGGIFKTPEAKSYMNKFVGWCKARYQPMDLQGGNGRDNDPSNETVMRCSKCDQEFGFPAGANTLDQVCPDCKSPLELVL